jgi:hypothetical protein
VTATRDRRSDPEEDGEPTWDERSIFGKSRGLPWWGAVLIAFGLAAIAAAFDMQRQDSLGRVYQGAYIVGCVAAICLVRRNSLFGPMVQPPLVFAVTAVAAVVTLAPDTGAGGGLKSLIFSVALPLTSNFPTMAGTTAATVAIGVFRTYRERDPDLGTRLTRGQRRAAQARGRREPDEIDFDARDDTGSRRRPEARESRRGGDAARRGERRGESGRRGAAGRRDPEERRGSAGRRGGDAGRARGERGRGRSDGESDEGGRGYGRRPGRPERSTSDSRGERSSSRSSRGRSREGGDAPRRRESSGDRPRRDDRSRRESGERGSRESGRRQDPLR